MKKLPVFVYGTLKEGFHNYDRLLKDQTKSIQKATLENYDMYSVNGRYPAVISGEGIIAGELMEIKDQFYNSVMIELDYLEVYNESDHENSLYLRETKMVTLENGELVEAYVYIWNQLTPLKKIANGNWNPQFADY